jgi:acetylornithine deacetylase
MAAPSAAPGAADLAWAFEWLERLCARDTTTGSEDAGLAELLELLGELGARIVRQPVAPGRTNVLALWGTPRLLFTTHLDTVPPYLPPRRAGTALWGRGTLDAKGQTLTQLLTVRRMLAAGAPGLAWLGVVGEETDSIGAKQALRLAGELPGLAGVIDGEPTGLRLATGQRGAQHLRLGVRGLAAHSSVPERGRSAIWPLIEWLGRLREIPGRSDPDLGPEIWNLGLVSGGDAPNVVPSAAAAELFVRTLPGSGFAAAARRLAPPDASLEILSETAPDRYPVLPGFPSSPVPFGSDAPRVRDLAPSRRVALVGPGAIELAHSPEERLELAELGAGVALLERVARALLAD